VADYSQLVPMTETQTFDLTEPSRLYTADRRGPRIALLLGVLVTVAGVLGVSLKVAFQLESGYRLSSNQVYLFVSFVVLFGCLALILYWLRAGTAPGATRIALSNEGIELRGPGARLDRRLWTDPRTLFELQDFSTERTTSATTVPYFLVMKRGRTTAITKEAHDAILAESEARGLVLPNRPNQVRSLFVSGPPPTFYRIRGGPTQKSN
jgi:hypothetical protein